MNAELNHHLGYEKHAPEGRGSGNNRNGKSRKKVQGERSKCLATATGPSSRRSFPSTTTLLRLRREDSVDVRARDEYARHTGPPGRDVRSGGEPGADQ
jgi:hypothetical protein